jgi:hypothetical protein
VRLGFFRRSAPASSPPGERVPRAPHARVRGRGRFVICALLLPALLVLPVPGVAAGDGPAPDSPGALSGPPRLPEVGAWFGINASAAREEAVTRIEGFELLEELAGRKMAMARVYMIWDEEFPTKLMDFIAERGTIPLFSLQTSRDREPIVSWASVAAGRQDAKIDAVATEFKELGVPAFFAFHHEPEGEGDAADYVAAYQHVHDRFQAVGATNVSFAEILMAYTFRQGTAEQWYAGDEYVDVLGADGYNWYGCPGRNDPWVTFEWVFEDFYNFGLDKGVPMIIGEWASMEDPLIPGRKAAWLVETEATLKQWPEIKAISYYDNGREGGATCDWWIDSSDLGLAAFQAMGADPYFNPPPPVVNIVSAPPDPDSSSSATFEFTANRPRVTFTCSLDGGVRLPCVSPHTYTGLSDGDHTVTIEATDPEGGPTGRVVYGWTVDATAPVATILWGPTEFTQATEALFHLETSEPDSGGFTCALDFVPTPECRQWVSYEGLSDGVHTFVARAYDDAGNQSPAVRWTWTVDTDLPTATILSGPPSRTQSRTATFELESDEPGSTFRCSLDGGAFIICVSPKIYEGVPDGRHTFAVVAVDAAKNESPPDQWTWTVDATP